MRADSSVSHSCFQYLFVLFKAYQLLYCNPQLELANLALTIVSASSQYNSIWLIQLKSIKNYMLSIVNGIHILYNRVDLGAVCVSKLVLYFDFGDFDAQKLEYCKNFGPYVLFFPAALSRKFLIPLVFLRIPSSN
jgi:hypothetical protein